MTATLDNTVFYSVAIYSDVDKATQSLRKTAKFYGIPLVFPIYEREGYTTNFDTKITRMIPILKQWKQEGKQYVFYNDCVDTVYTDTADNILQVYNTMQTDGVLFNHNGYTRMWPCPLFIEKVINENGVSCVLNSGLFAGRIDDVLTLFELAFDIHEHIKYDSFKHSILQSFPNDIIDFIKGEKELCLKSDQFYMHMFQYLGHHLIQVDKDCQLLSIFDILQELPFIRHRRQQFSCADVNYIGTAKILHSPWLGDNNSGDNMWKSWINKEVTSQRFILPYPLEIVTNFDCNLNCNYCGHLAPFLKGERYSVQQLEKVCQDWHALIDPKCLHLMNESLIHPDIEEILTLFNHYWEQPLVISTNGLILDSLPNSVYDLIDRYDVLVRISLQHEKFRDRVEKSAKEKLRPGRHFIVDYTRDHSWCKRYQLSENKLQFYTSDAHKAYQNCWFKNECCTIAGNRLYRCSSLPYMVQTIKCQKIEDDRVFLFKAATPDMSVKELQEWWNSDFSSGCVVCPEKYEMLTISEKFN